MVFGGFFTDLTRGWDTISTNLPKVESTGHSGSSSILIMQASIVVLRNCLDKRCHEEDEEEEEDDDDDYDEFLGVFTFLEITLT